MYYSVIATKSDNSTEELFDGTKSECESEIVWIMQHELFKQKYQNVISLAILPYGENS